jgi:6,7-dimethyl-8-ribityllumazine synthase
VGRRLEGAPAGQGRRIALVVARFNEMVTSPLARGARECLLECGVREDDIDEIRVPGAFEVPMAARAAARSGHYDAVVCLGAVIRGETPHFDYVAGECARGVSEVARETGVPAAFGVLTTDTVEQAVERAGGKLGNKGWDAARTALEMVSLLADSRLAPAARRGGA